MPQINRIRVNNVKYNFGTQFYDDFVMRFSGENTIYDLANGGGKSILMLLLFQNLIPNCTLDEKQPIEKLFRSGNDNTVIHSLIEWKLNACDVKNGFQYMTTGFCARKAKDRASDGEEGRDTAAVEYFNYCIFYRDFQENDILNLPLSGKEERITFQGLKNYLRDLDKKDFSVQVHVFDRKGDYQQFISNYGLYESEWEIIRGINKTEGHVRAYFETHYKTTRKVVEDLLIEEIIEKSFRTKTQHVEGEQEIAQTLLDIRDKLMELAKKKGEISHYDSQMEALDSFVTRLSGLRGVYGRKAELEEELVKTNYTAQHELQQKKSRLEELEERTSDMAQQRAAMTRNLENVRLMGEEHILDERKADAGKIRARYELYENNCRLMEKELNELEAANDFFDYLEQKKQLEVLKNVLAGSLDNHEEVLEELYTLSYNRRLQIEKEQLELQEKKEQYDKESGELQKQLAVLDKEERRAQQEAAVFESTEGRLSLTVQELEEQLEKLRKKTGSGQTQLVLLENSKEQLDKKTKEQEEAAAELEQIRQQRQKAETAIEKMSWESEQQKEHFTAVQKEHEHARQRLKKLEDGQKKLDQLEEIYGAKGAKALLERTLEAYKGIGAKTAALREGIEQRKEELALEEVPVPMRPREAVQKLVAYVNRHFDEKACAGCEYVMRFEPEEREALLEKMPFLPYSVVIFENFVDLSVDRGLQKMSPEGEFILFVEQSLLARPADEWAEQRTVFALQDNGIFYDKEKIEHLFEVKRTKLRKMEEELARLQENEQVLKEDMAFLYTVLQEEEALQTIRESYRKTLGILKSRQTVQKEKEKQEKELKEQIKALEALCKEKEEIYRKNQQTCENLAKMEQLYQQLVQKEKELQACRRGKEEARNVENKCLKQLKELRHSQAKSEQAARNVEQALQKAEEDWKRYARYYKEDGKFPVLEITAEELESLFEGRRLIYEQEHADVSDKKQLIAVHETAMKKCLESIRYKGFEIEALEKLNEEHRLVRTPLEQLMRQKGALEREQDVLANSVKEMADAQTKLDRQEGSVRYGKSAYEEKYGAYEPLELEPGQWDIYVRETKERLETLSGQSADFQKEQKELEKLCSRLESMMEELERMVQNFEIPAQRYEGALLTGVSLYDTYKSVRKKYERMAKEEQSRREEFEKDKARLQDTLKMLGAYDLAQEIERSLARPGTLQDVDMQIQKLSKTMECILLEKERIVRGIENMEVIKENFENRCLQTCSTIKEALERLPGLSVIRLDDKPVHMITLQIPYVREEQYKERISRYIDEIVEQADSFHSTAERLKFIRSRLAWKRLFSVIVKDMDRIRLQLYKRERMKEQSRYLKYEEAVGSTGQSQGIYIQFLVAVIHYISSMNAKKADASVLKKVIFLDNPFGAAKDIYIWEPIFQLLRANHVQLIVPARGATPAITGRFAVNYILGQKLAGGRQQTVVVDYRSQVQTGQIEYKEIEYEQGILQLDEEPSGEEE